MLTANYFDKNAPSQIMLPLSISLGHHFELRISHFSQNNVYGHPKGDLGLLWRSFLAHFEQQIGPKIFKTIRQIYFSIHWQIVLKVRHTNLELFCYNVFLNKESRCAMNL